MEKPYDLANASSHLLDAIYNIDNAFSDSVFSAEDVKVLRTVQRESAWI